MAAVNPSGPRQEVIVPASRWGNTTSPRFPTGGAPALVSDAEKERATYKQKQTQAIEDLNWGSVSANGQQYDQPFTGTAQDLGSYKLTPNSKNHIFDIVNKFKWTYSNYKAEVPRLYLIEKELKGNQQIRYYQRLIGALGPGEFKGGIVDLFGSSENLPLDISDPYAGLYNAEDTGFSYIFPYYTATNTTNKNSWTDKVPNDANIISALPNASTVIKGGLFIAEGILAASGVGAPVIAGVESFRNSMGDFSGMNLMDAGVDKLAKAQAISHGAGYAGIEQPMYFSGPSKNAYVVKFPLFNTNSIVDIRQNYDFIRAFQYQNLFNRLSIATYKPPVIYKSENSPGAAGAGGDLHASPLGTRLLYVSDFTVDNVGSIRSININAKNKYRVSVPEVFNVSITFTDLFGNSQNLYSSVMTGSSLIKI